MGPGATPARRSTCSSTRPRSANPGRRASGARWNEASRCTSDRRPRRPPLWRQHARELRPRLEWPYARARDSACSIISSDGFRAAALVTSAPMIDLNGVRLRNRTLASASLVGYGARPPSRLVPYGLSPVAQFLPLEKLGAVTTRTLTLEPREGHFTTRTDWRVRDWPRMLRMYSGRCAASTPAGSTRSAGATSASTRTCATTSPAPTT